MRAAFLFMMTVSSIAAEALNYPQTRKEDVVDTLHGVKIADPYRWLEDDNSEETLSLIHISEPTRPY